MRFFSILDFQHWVFAVALGFILLLSVYIAWRGYPRDREPVDDPDHKISPDFIPESNHHPVAPILIFIYAGTVLWVLGYLLVIGILGGPII